MKSILYESAINRVASFNALSIDERPLSFMGSLADQHQLEQTIYRKAFEFCSEYRGGAWRYFDCGKGIVFMAPEAENNFNVAIDLSTQASFSSIAFGLIVTVTTMDGLSIKPKYEFLNYRRDKLLDIIEEHNEAQPMVSFLNNLIFSRNAQ